jgi:hypothetical protein
MVTEKWRTTDLLAAFLAELRNLDAELSACPSHCLRRLRQRGAG